MAEWKLTRPQIKSLAKQVKKDQSKTEPAERLVKIPATFKKAVKKMARTPLPKKRR